MIKKWLYRAWNIECEIDELKELRDKAYDEATKITTSLSGMPGSPSKNPHVFERYIEIADKYNDLILIKLRIVEEIQEAINTVENTQQRTALMKRYINCKSWEQISAEMKLSARRVQEICVQGEKALSNMQTLA